MADKLRFQGVIGIERRSFKDDDGEKVTYDAFSLRLADGSSEQFRMRDLRLPDGSTVILEVTPGLRKNRVEIVSVEVPKGGEK